MKNGAVGKIAIVIVGVAISLLFGIIIRGGFVMAEKSEEMANAYFDYHKYDK